MSTTTDILARLSGMSADHGPDGWPAVRMREITALCEEVTRLRAALAQAGAGAGREPVASVSRSNDMEGLVQWAGKRLPVGTLLYAHPSPAQREPLSDDPWRKLYRRAINEANGLTNYVEDRPELRSAERRISAIEAEERALDAHGITTSGTKGAAS